MDVLLNLPIPLPAQRLLGCVVHRRLPSGEILSGRIVECEFYHQSDPASHSYGGQTPRTRPMFGPHGHAYVYASYGIHRCLNITALPAGVGCGVLIRALDPLTGIEQMRKHRGLDDIRKLTTGPGCIGQALDVGLSFSGSNVLAEGAELYVTQGEPVPDEQIGVSPRIGITRAMEVPWRFFIKDNPYVSGPKIVKVKKTVRVTKVSKRKRPEDDAGKKEIVIKKAKTVRTRVGEEEVRRSTRLSSRYFAA